MKASEDPATKAASTKAASTKATSTKAASTKAAAIAPFIVEWQRAHGRHDLPWQSTRDPYRVWLSEIMLQQTQVATVVPYYRRFLARFPDVRSLAAADIDAVLGAWSGLGYYSRARNLHRAAGIVAASGWPDDVDGLQALPGIGRSTAAAIASFCFGRRAAILDGNVRRVFARVFGEPADDGSGIARLWAHADRAIATPDLADEQIASYIQGLMDLGATVCARTRPVCQRCPLAAHCTALALDAVDRFPARRRPRSVPVRCFDLLLIRQGRRVLLERRAPSGVWGGLWSLPVMRTGAADADCAPEEPNTAKPSGFARAWGETLTRLAINTIEPGARLPAAPLARFEHVFTHFRMRASVWSCELHEHDHLLAADAVSKLVPLDPGDSRAFVDAPLPGPIRALLSTLRLSFAPPGCDEPVRAARSGRRSP